MKLTLPQQDIYFEQLLFPDEPIYNIGAKIEIKGKLNIQSIKTAYSVLIDQHDAYRMILKKDGESVIVDTLEYHNSELGFVDFSEKKDPDLEANSYMQMEFMKPFDLMDKNLLHKFILVKVHEKFHYLFSVYHHIITDGWGTSLMFQRLVKNYNEIEEFETVQSEYPFTYKNFAENDEVYQNSEVFLADKEYWSNRFKELPENILEKISDLDLGHKSKRKELIIKRTTYNQLNELAKNSKASTFHLILSILYLYFGRKHQNEDFAIGLPVLNRGKAAFKKTVGVFMGVSPLRISLNTEKDIKDLIINVKNQLRQDYRHQRFPLGKMIQELQLFKEKERLFNITLSYEKQNYANNFNGTATKVIPLTHQSERVALAIYIREFDESEDVKIDFDYNLNYFDESSIEKTVFHIEKLIEEILRSPDKKIKELNFLTSEEEKEILKGFNTSAVPYDKDITFLDVFARQVIRTPSGIAVRDEEVRYTYAELNKRTNQVAQYLISVLANEDKSPIAVMMTRSVDLITILLAILKTGRSYIPLDPIFPKERIQYILRNSETKSIVKNDGHDLDHIDGVTLIQYEDIVYNLENQSGNLNSRPEPEDLAYIIYTSGSTGNPKGVKIAHQSLLNLLGSMKCKPGIEQGDVLFSVTTCSFDISILEFFAPLLCGGTVYIASNDELSNPELIIEKFNQIKPTIIQATPSFYQMLFNADWQGDNKLKVLCGGDLLSESLAEKLLNTNLELWNMYGPTECTIWSSIKKINTPKEASNIGTPIHNTQFYILDKYLNPMPVGVMGALYIGGDGLAKGYHKKPDLTREKFIKNPFGIQERIYETGDVGKWNEKGEIEFLGRNDNQVKIRGYRIELGEIETRINLINEVIDAVVIAKKGAEQNDLLVAYVKVEAGFNVQDIIQDLRVDLPEYMIPFTIISLQEFPLTPNKKVDRKLLSQRKINNVDNRKECVIASSEVEIKLSKYWSEILNIEEGISIESNFFALGGNSLNAVKLIAEINNNFSTNINLKTIFDNPTITLLSQYLYSKIGELTQEKVDRAEDKEKYELTSSQNDLWLASQQKEMSIAYNMFTAYKVKGTLDLNKLTIGVRTIIQKHEILRTNFVEENGQPYQKINSAEQVKFNISVQESSISDDSEVIRDFINLEFNLETDILLRIKLFKQGDINVLIFCSHHLIMDGWSLEIFTKECIKNYNQLPLNKIQEKNELAYQFKDYSEWYVRNSKENINQDFWSNYLKDFQGKNSFIRDKETNTNSFSGEEYKLELTIEDTGKIKDFAKEYKRTIHTLLITALNALIYKTSNHTDICIGTVNSGRSLPGFMNNIGMFVKTLPLRTQIHSDQSFVELIKNTEDNLIELDTNQNIPLPEKQRGLFDVLIVYQNTEFSHEKINELDGVELKSFPVASRYSRLPISFNFFELENKLTATVSYNSEMYSREGIQIISHKYALLLNQIIKNPKRKLSEIDISIELKKAKVVDFDFNF